MSAQRQEKTDAKIDTVHNELNGRLSQLLKAENAQGRQDERDSR